ncbi:4Fe-4S dicluster domain-containing protein [Methanoplanus sp. FWC-SCC4]|uniref:4Fe-4S dicluster domain-containing protein n=1 Tax=Methanochimaera problematica TaxID=2609417 RepID=A0AA97FC36_9EURY|nr:ATP-binding protein [Methanoplanus sp. FWC-SCC4]WOF16137.1 4Fe-4S dicluster domain-containing protein [Methanoplanus sp. FWC-SCC4]
MKKIAVISGKGGTGKTTFTAGFAKYLDEKKLCFVDCDVDAANAGILFNHVTEETKDFFGGNIAEIDQNVCVKCGSCMENCRFSAIYYDSENEQFQINPVKCEGCGVCTIVCPFDAVSLGLRKTGEIYISKTKAFPLIHASLEPGCGASGLLVKRLKKTAEEKYPGSEVMLIDGPPGIGCPFIATVSGTDYAVVVVEPGLSALHDLKRAIRVALGFGTKILVVINRFDLNPDICRQIESFCENEGINVAGRVPYDDTVFKAVREQRPVTDYDCPASKSLIESYERITDIISNNL